MSGLIITALVILVFIIIYQIAKASEYANILRGEEKVSSQTNKFMAAAFLVFYILGLYGLYKCHVYLEPLLLPESASVQGVEYDSMMHVTLIITGIVFLSTQTLLFWFAFKYQAKDNRKPFFYAHNTRLEIVWTTIPAIVLMILVAIGLKNWMTITDDAPAGSNVVQVVGKQFNWVIRYPGPDGIFGKTDFRLINEANNVLGLDWNDPASKDDILIENGEVTIVNNENVKFVINSRDVIHDVGLPHFRLKMDAVPGITTTLWFTPRFTTAEMKTKTGNPDFVYEIACDQMCGKGHYSMRGIVTVVTPAQYKQWISEQTSYWSLHNEVKPAVPAAGEEAAKEAAKPETEVAVKTVAVK